MNEKNLYFVFSFSFESWEQIKDLFELGVLSLDRMIEERKTQTTFVPSHEHLDQYRLPGRRQSGK